ncbi:MAG: corrinoid protein [Candidatus Bathyarchaeia archaeon]
MNENIFNDLTDAIVNGNMEKAEELTKKALEVGIPPLDIFKKGLSKGLELVGEKFSKLELFLTDMMLSADAVKASMDILKPRMTTDKLQEVELGKIVIGTVSGDIHDIGKNLVSIMLSVAGFEIHDLGVDVATKTFVKVAEEKDANIIALSSLMTTTRAYQKEVIRYLQDTGKRSKYFVIVGGGAVTSDWAKEIKADGYGKHAEDGLKICRELIDKKVPPPLDSPIIIE